MRLQLTLAPARRRACLATFLLVACAAASAHADEASGTWTGTLEGRGNYYWETSTRVVVPTVKLDVEAPNGVRLGGEYLVDVISSASIAQTGSDVDAVFTELRHGIGVSVGKELDLQDPQLDVSARAMYSTEDDYDSLIYGVDTALSMGERNSTLRLGATIVDDEIRANNDPEFVGELDGLTLGFGFEQVLNRTTLLSLSYQVAWLDGFLGNPYRRAAFTGNAPLREAPPGERVRHNGSATLAFFVPQSDTAIHLSYRAYVDSWDVGALTPEAKIYQHFGRRVIARARYRLYTQTQAWFTQRPRDGMAAAYPVGWEGPTTNDPKLTEFETHTLGLKLDFQTSFLADTFLDFAREGWIDLSFDRYWSSNTFGDGVIASAGGRLPF